ncbi:MAG: twin-arginine translocation signal domain-containing protein, partial [Candidatus Omnitrophota bacterium]
MKKMNVKKDSSILKGKVSRRGFLKLGGIGVATAAVAGVADKVEAVDSTLKGKKLAMVIDLQRCSACGGCTIACMNENNVQEGVAWAYHEASTEG